MQPQKILLGIFLGNRREEEKEKSNEKRKEKKRKEKKRKERKTRRNIYVIIWRVNDYLENEGKGRVACKPKGGEQKIVYDIFDGRNIARTIRRTRIKIKISKKARASVGQTLFFSKIVLGIFWET